MADSDGQVVIDLSLRKDGIQSDIQWLTDNLKNIGANVSADQISEKFENAMNDAKGTVKEAINDINGEKAEPKIGANDEQLKDKAEESKEQLDSIGNRKVSAKIKADAANLLEKAEQSDKALDKIPKSVKSEIIAQANDAGIINFEKILDKIPKSVKTELVANVRDGKAIDFEETLRKIPKEKATTLKVSDEATEPVKRYTSSVSQASEKTHTLRDVMMGTFVGGLVQSGISAITNGLHAMTQAGEEYNVQQDTMKINWENLTREAPQDGKDMVSMINDFAQKSIYSSECLDKMAQSFYHVHSNAQETKQWTQDFVNLGSTLHVSNDALAEAAEQFAKIEAGGKANAEDMQVMINRFPMFSEALTKATGKSMQQLYQLSAQGKLTADVFTKAMDELGEKYNKSQAEAMTSFQGMTMHLKSQFSVLSGDIMQSSFQMSKSALDAINKLTSNDSMQKYAQSISQAFGTVLTGVTKVIKYVADHQEDIMNVISSLGKIVGTIGSSVWNTFKGVISGIASAFNSLSGNASKSNDPLKNVSNALKEIASHKQALKDIGTILASIFVTKKISGFIIGLTSFVAKAKEVTGIVDGLKATFAMLGGPIGIAVAAITGLTVAFVGLYKNNPKFKAFVDGIVKGAKQVAENVGKFFGQAFKAIGDFFKGQTKWQKDFGKFVSGIVKDAQSMVKGVTQSKPAKAFQDIGKSISDLLKGNITFKQFCSKISSDFGTLGKFFAKTSPFGLITKAIGNLVKDTKFGRWCTSTVNQVKKMGTDIGKNVKSMASDVTKCFNDMMNQAGKKISTGWKNMTHDISNGVKAVVDSHSKLHNQVISKVRDTMGVSSTTFKNGYKTIQDYTKTWHDLVSGNWSDLNGDLKRVTNDLVSTAKSLFKDMYNKLDDMTNGKLTDIRNTWHKIWDDITEKVGSCVRSIGNHAVDIVNNVIKPINDMISKVTDGVNWVIDKFGGDKIKAPTIPELSHFATGGTVGSGGTFAMVNDSGDDDYREMFATPDGKIGAFPEQRDFMTFLPEGTQVLDGKSSRMLADMMGIPAFKDGTKDKNLFEKIFDKAHDIFDDIKDILAHPLEFLEKIFTNKIGKLSAKAAFPEELIKHAPSAFAKWGINWVKKLAQDFKEQMESGSGNGVSYGSANNPGGAGVARWRPVIIEAFKNLGQDNPPDWKIEKLLRQIATESGGNPNAHQGNIGDINNLRGTPAQGLLQFVPSTFAAWSRPGHTNIYSGLDQLMAAIYCLDHGGEGGWGNIGNGHGWDNGGIVDYKQKAWIAENNREYVINPQRASADELLRKAAEERVAYDPNSEIAKAISGMNMARQSNGSMIPNVTQISNAYTSSNPAVASSVQDNRPINISVELDGRTIANVSYPYQKMLQASDIRIQARKGGGAFA